MRKKGIEMMISYYCFVGVKDAAIDIRHPLCEKMITGCVMIFMTALAVLMHYAKTYEM